jgi:hypothetical protein
VLGFKTSVSLHARIGFIPEIMSRGDNDQMYHDQFVPPPDNVGAASPSGDDSDSYNSFEVYDDDDEYQFKGRAGHR